MSPNSEDQGRLRKGSFSFYESTMQQIEALAEQRKRERDTDLQKQALDIGSLFLSIKGAPDRQTGRYGNWQAEDLAEELRPWVLLGLDWLERHGHRITSSGVSPAAIEALLGARTHMASGPEPSPTKKRTEEERPEAIIDANVLSALNLDDSPML